MVTSIPLPLLVDIQRVFLFSFFLSGLKQLWFFTLGYISVKTTALAEDCVVAEMAKLVEEAQNRKSKTQRFVDKFAKFYTPGIQINFSPSFRSYVIALFYFDEIVA